MAQLAKTSCPGNWDVMVGGDYNAEFKRTEAMLNELMNKSTQVDPNGDLTGAVLKFQVADSYAWYVVCKDKPLTLQHVPYCDAWGIDAAHLRGIRRQDVVQQLNRDKYWRKIMDKKA